MACRLFSPKPLFKQMQTYYQLDPKQHIWMTFDLKFQSFYLRKYISKYRLQNGSHFVSEPMS